MIRRRRLCAPFLPFGSGGSLLRHDVVVVGAGLAGMRAAIEAKRAGADVAIVSKLHPTRSHSGSAEGGINAALGNAVRGQPRDPHVRHGQGLRLPGRPGRDRDHVHRGAGRHLRARAHGRGLLALRRRPHRAAPVRRRGLAAHRLLGRHHGPRADPRALRAAAEVRGAGLRGVLRDRPRDRRRPLRRRARLGHRLAAACTRISAHNTILATGGVGRMYYGTTNAYACTGDGMSMAWRAGVPLKDMEFMQFHPTTLKSNGVLITEGCRGEGAYLRNSNGDRFMAEAAPNAMELASRDVVSRAETREIEAGRGVDGCVLLDLTHLGAEEDPHAAAGLARARDGLRGRRSDPRADPRPARRPLPHGRRRHGRATGRRSCPACTPPASARASRCTAPTASAATR